MSEKRSPLILDLHIPYCIRPLKYLAYFHETGTNAQKDAYLEAMKREAASYEGELEGYEIRAVRLGGGSATVMSPDLLGSLLTLVRRVLPVSPHAEISFDALPNTIGTPSLTGIAAGHPTRAELMMRSENDEELRALDCPFTMQDTRNAMLFFQKFHLNNIGVTINYGIPGQTLHSWHNTLHSCVIMRPGHISVMPLDAPGGEADKTKDGFAGSGSGPCGVSAEHAGAPNGAVSGGTAFPDEAARREMYEYACDFLQKNGYSQYSVYGFALPHYECRYELLRMDGTPHITMGVNGVSVFEGYVTRNTNNCALYVKNAGDFEKLTAQAFEADEEFLMREYASGRLGLVQGLSEKAFAERFGKKLPPQLEKWLEDLTQKGLAVQENGTASLTREGMFRYRKLMETL